MSWTLPMVSPPHCYGTGDVWYKYLSSMSKDINYFLILFLRNGRKYTDASFKQFRTILIKMCDSLRKLDRQLSSKALSCFPKYIDW